MNYIDFKVRDIKRVNFFIPECMEHALVSYGETLNIDFVKAFSNAWKFDYEEVKTRGINSIGKSISQKNVLIYDYDAYNGIHIRYVEVENVLDLIKVIQDNGKRNLPTLIHMDTYYSYWGFLYNKVHSGHIAVAIGVDCENKTVCIVDPDFSEKSFCVEFSLLEEATKFYVDVDIYDSDKYSYDELLQEICKRKELYMKQFGFIEEFAEMFLREFDPVCEFGTECDIDRVLDSEIIEKIREIIKGRNLFIVFLEKLLGQYRNIDQVIEYMYISIGKWNTIMNLFFKAVRTEWKRDFNEKIYRILMSIAMIERKAYNQLYGCKKEFINTDGIESTCDTKRQCITTDISKSCNNKGFIFENEAIERCDLTGAGEYIELNNDYNNLVHNEIIFECFFKNKFDNIVCNGQIIDLGIIDHAFAVEILVCAEWGGCEDSVNLIDHLGYEVGRKITANDISEVNLDDVLIIGKSKKMDGTIVNEQVGVTHNSIILDKEIVLKGIRLPVNPNMHIVAISLLQKNRIV